MSSWAGVRRALFFQTQRSQIVAWLKTRCPEFSHHTTGIFPHW